MMRNVFLLCLALTLAAVSMVGCKKNPPAPKPVPVPENDCIDKSQIGKYPCDKIQYFRYAPVCGCDGKTYESECEARNAGVKHWTEGPCSKKDDCIDESKIDRNAICTQEYAPVCGCNNVTYGNECEARAAGVRSWKPGECQKVWDCLPPKDTTQNSN